MDFWLNEWGWRTGKYKIEVPKNGLAIAIITSDNDSGRAWIKQCAIKDRRGILFKFLRGAYEEYLCQSLHCGWRLWFKTPPWGGFISYFTFFDSTCCCCDSWAHNIATTDTQIYSYKFHFYAALYRLCALFALLGRAPQQWRVLSMTKWWNHFVVVVECTSQDSLSVQITLESPPYVVLQS